VLVGAGEHIEYAGLAAVRIAGKGYGDIFELVDCHPKHFSKSQAALT